MGDHHHIIALVVSERGLSEDTNGIGVTWDSIYPRRYPTFMAAAMDPMYVTISKKIYVGIYGRPTDQGKSVTER